MTITIENNQLRIVINPEIGGSLVRFDALTDTDEIALMRPGSLEEQDPNQLAMYPLLPWSNRIAGGCFAWQGEHYPLAANLPGEPLPIHGDGWQQPWQIVSQSRYSLRLQLRSDQQPPFDYRAELSYNLIDNSLEVALCVTHLGEQPVPYGVGLHPWFPRTVDARITALSQGVWEVDKAQLPREWRPLAANEAWNFSVGQELPEQLIDNLFTGWNGHAWLDWPSRGVALEVTTTPAMSRYLVFSPHAQSDFFCFEPVSHTVDAHHSRTPFSQGLVELSYGQTTSMTCHFTLR